MDVKLNKIFDASIIEMWKVWLYVLFSLFQNQIRRSNLTFRVFFKSLTQQFIICLPVRFACLSFKEVRSAQSWNTLKVTWKQITNLFSNEKISFSNTLKTIRCVWFIYISKDIFILFTCIIVWDMYAQKLCFQILITHSQLSPKLWNTIHKK